MADSTTPSTEDRVRDVINTIRPVLQRDGGDIELIGVTGEGVVSVRLQGACSGCPSAAMTLSMLVERKLKAEVPEVTELVAVE